MGTSASNKGGSGSGNLLPSWYGGGDGGAPAPPPPAPPGPNGLPPPPASPTPPPSAPAPMPPAGLPPLPPAVPAAGAATWRAARTAFGRYLTNRTPGNLRSAGKSYMRNLGGATSASRSAATGVSAGSRLASFLGTVSVPTGGGLNQTLSSIGLGAHTGQPPEFLLAKIADSIAPVGATSDEAIAREAVMSTLDWLYTDIVDAGGDITAFETLTAVRIREVVIEYTSCYIYKKWVYELGIAIEKKAVSEQEAIKMEIDIREYIRVEVRTKFQDLTPQQLDLTNPNNQATIEYIFQLAYRTLEL
jgi:hypothetical protein